MCKDGSLPLINRARSLRRGDLNLCIARRKAMSDDISHVGCMLYNELPIEIKTESNFFLFKGMLKSYLLSRNESLIKHGQFANKSFFL